MSQQHADDIHADDIKELYNQLKTEGFKPEKLSEKQLLYLSRVGLHWDYLSSEQQDESVRNFYAKYGLNPLQTDTRMNFKRRAFLF